MGLRLLMCWKLRRLIFFQPRWRSSGLTEVAGGGGLHWAPAGRRQERRLFKVPCKCQHGGGSAPHRAAAPHGSPTVEGVSPSAFPSHRAALGTEQSTGTLGTCSSATTQGPFSVPSAP